MRDSGGILTSQYLRDRIEAQLPHGELDYIYRTRSIYDALDKRWDTLKCIGDDVRRVLVVCPELRCNVFDRSEGISAPTSMELTIESMNDVLDAGIRYYVSTVADVSYSYAYPRSGPQAFEEVALEEIAPQFAIAHELIVGVLREHGFECLEHLHPVFLEIVDGYSIRVVQADTQRPRGMPVPACTGEILFFWRLYDRSGEIRF